jgi:hypothetical protein
LKKKEKETFLAPLPYSPFTPYDHKDLDTKYAPERIIVEDVKEYPYAFSSLPFTLLYMHSLAFNCIPLVFSDKHIQTPRDLEIDLKCLRDYTKNEGKFAAHHISFHPFQYIGDHADEADEV